MTQETYPTMFQYLLRMHKDGKVLAEIHLNVPTSCFREVQMNSIMAMEAMLVDLGKEKGWTRSDDAAKTVEPASSGV